MVAQVVFPFSGLAGATPLAAHRLLMVAEMCVDGIPLQQETAILAPQTAILAAKT